MDTGVIENLRLLPVTELTDSEMSSVHEPSHVELVAALSADSKFTSGDMYTNEHTRRAVYLSAGATLAAASAVYSGTCPYSLCMNMFSCSLSLSLLRSLSLSCLILLHNRSFGRISTFFPLLTYL